MYVVASKARRVTQVTSSPSEHHQQKKKMGGREEEEGKETGGGLCERLVTTVVTKCQLAADVVRSDKKGWLICGAVLLVTIVRSGITYSFGQIVVGLESTYHKSLAEQSK